MPKWIHGPGFYLVQSTEKYDADKLKREMVELEEKILMAERYWANRKGPIVYEKS
ncbi:hypothetical protein GGGNBK_19015 [Sporosarcina sp. ANT_H38]|uniref:hypothetical protein n=1 Tax=Sporosarcina sp. ANT_H38 TaxID=2597358 RepID=UPI00165E28D8|nr:hypothetical protein [Sporosarcina sp. ANT_H38]